MRKENGKWRMENGKRTSLRAVLLFTFFLLFFIFKSFSQTVSATLERDKILIGEQVTLQLKADVNDRNYSLVSWFNFPDTINHLEVVKRGNIDTVETGGSTSYVQTLTLTSFDSGLWKLPALFVVLQNNSSSKQLSFKADTLSLQVLPVDVSNMQDYHDIKSIIQVEGKSNTWMIVVIVAVLVVLIVLLVWLLLKKRKKKPVQVQEKPVFKGTPLQWAMEQLDMLKSDNLLSKNKTKIFYTRLDEIYRMYFEMQFRSGILQLTGDELMRRVKLYYPGDTLRNKFYQLIMLCEAVKFAKYIPEDAENNAAISTAREAIQFVDANLQLIRK